jgi:hypothetical protein
MAVVGTAEELWGAREASFDGGIWTRTRAFLVKTDYKYDSDDVARTALGLPAYAEAHPADATCYATTLSAKQKDETPFAWVITVGYSSERELNEDPEADEVLVSWSSEIYQEPVFEDVNGAAIMNSAGDYFIDPTPTREAAHLIAKIRVNVASVPAWVLSYQNAVNNSAITIGGLAIGTGLAKMQRLDIGERQLRGTSPFYEVSFEIHIHNEGWRLTPLDAGFRYLVSGLPVQIKIDDTGAISTTGDEPTTPIPLDGTGQVLTGPTPGTAVFADFQVYPELDFTALPGIT